MPACDLRLGGKNAGRLGGWKAGKLKDKLKGKKAHS